VAAESLALVRVFEVLSLFVGLSIVYYALKAFRRSHHKPMISLAIAFLLLTTAGLVEGVLFEVFHYDLIDARVGRSALTLAGLAVVLYSIYKTQ